MYEVKYKKLDQRDGFFRGRMIIINSTFETIKKWKVRMKLGEGHKIKAMNFYKWTQNEEELLIEPVHKWSIGKFRRLCIDFLGTYEEEYEDPFDLEIFVETESGSIGSIEVKMEPPMFYDHNFLPVIYFKDKEIHVPWGEKYVFEGLKDGEEHEIKAKTFIRNNKEFIPIIEPGIVHVKAGEISKCKIRYYEIFKEEETNFEVSYKITSQWSGGFNGSIEILNKGREVIKPWDLTFEFPNDQKVTSLWNGSFSQNGRKIRIICADWNKEIPVNGKVTLGFGAVFDGLNKTPKKFCLNGKGQEDETIDIKPNTAPDVEEHIKEDIKEDIEEDIKPEIMVDEKKNSIQSEEELSSENLVSNNEIIVQDRETRDIILNETPKSRGTGKLFTAYFQSWSDRWSSTGEGTDLANLPAYINVVILSFVKPDMVYKGGLNFRTTGLEFSYEGEVLKEAIELLRERNPHTRILVSVGGATYTNWRQLNADGIAKLVNDFKLDGIDIDYEPSDGFKCSINEDGLMQCNTDDEYVEIIEKLREVLPRPYTISAAPWSVGAYGEGKWKDSKPEDNGATGMMIRVLDRAGDKLDMINIMGYNAGDSYNPTESLEAYANYFKGDVVLGAMVPPEDLGSHVWSLTDIRKVAGYIKDSSAAGMMLWSIHRKALNSSEEFPDNQMMAREIAKELGLQNYDDPLFPLEIKNIKIKE